MLVKTDYGGWVLLEASGKPEDPIAELIEQRTLFDELRMKAQKGRSPEAGADQ